MVNYSMGDGVYMETKLIEKERIEEIAGLLKEGKLVAFPTDTVFGLACVYDNEKSISDMKYAKERPDSKPFPLMVGSKAQIEEIAYVDDRTRRIIESWLPGALTLILKKKEAIPDYVTNGEDTIAIRMADDEFVLQLIKEVGKPLLVTSANISSQPSATSDSEAYAQLNGRIDGIVKGNSLGARASTIIDVTKDELSVLREGPISLDRINFSLKGD